MQYSLLFYTKKEGGGKTARREGRTGGEEREKGKRGEGRGEGRRGGGPAKRKLKQKLIKCINLYLSKQIDKIDVNAMIIMCRFIEFVAKAKEYKERLDAHMQLGRITDTQPILGTALDDPPPLDVNNSRNLRKTQVRAALARGQFPKNMEVHEEYTEWLQNLNPSYVPPGPKLINELREELHQDRLKDRGEIIKQMGPGGVVTDGCKGKQEESMMNFLYVEGLTGTPLYWDFPKPYELPSIFVYIDRFQLFCVRFRHQ